MKARRPNINWNKLRRRQPPAEEKKVIKSRIKAMHGFLMRRSSFVWPCNLHSSNCGGEYLKNKNGAEPSALCEAKMWGERWRNSKIKRHLTAAQRPFLLRIGSIQNCIECKNPRLNRIIITVIEDEGRSYSSKNMII